jgi:hypothetical protein
MMCWVLGSDQRRCFFLQIPITRREAVANGVQNLKLDMVGANYGMVDKWLMLR